LWFWSICPAGKVTVEVEEIGDQSRQCGEQNKASRAKKGEAQTAILFDGSGKQYGYSSPLPSPKPVGRLEPSSEVVAVKARR
jgi:hypothetical protein